MGVAAAVLVGLDVDPLEDASVVRSLAKYVLMRVISVVSGSVDEGVDDCSLRYAGLC